MHETAPIVCLNCDHPFTGSFCPACGQTGATGRLRVREIAGDAISQVFNLDAKVPRTLIGLTTAPGRVCREYVRGRRVGYVPPFRYCLILLTLTVLANLAIGFDPTSLTAQRDFTPLQEELRAMVAGFVVRSTPGRYQIQLREIEVPTRADGSGDRDADIEAGMRRLMAALETGIRSAPDQWFALSPIWTSALTSEGAAALPPRD